MSSKQTAFDNIRAAGLALEETRQALSAALFAHANDEGKHGGEYAELQDLHRRVSQASMLLPRGGTLR